MDRDIVDNYGNVSSGYPIDYVNHVESQLKQVTDIGIGFSYVNSNHVGFKYGERKKW